MVKDVIDAIIAETPLNLTWVFPGSGSKFWPLMVTEVPIGPLIGEKLLMIGGNKTVKWVELVAVPPGVVTVMGPVVAPGGTDVVIWVSVALIIPACTPLNFTMLLLG